MAIQGPLNDLCRDHFIRTPRQMLAFTHAQPHIVERLLYHIEAQPCAELLIRIIQTDGQLGGVGTLEVRHGA
jgi:hypothetical protein